MTDFYWIGIPGREHFVERFSILASSFLAYDQGWQK